MADPGERLAALAREIAACRRCVEAPVGAPLPHEPRPVLRVSPTARLAVAGQAPGTRVHASGIPFSDPSGDRLRTWMGVTAEEFYDVTRIAIVPMGFCFPGLDDKGGDLPPRRECAPAWRQRLFDLMPAIELILLVGGYAQAWHLRDGPTTGVTATVQDWRRIAAVGRSPRLLPLPHPSWRNSGWLKANPWFTTDLLPELRRDVRALI
jgi:uracil-DNA glycosylase